ncbi:unnamed protein product, partial [Urochloa humidicola]
DARLLFCGRPTLPNLASPARQPDAHQRPPRQRAKTAAVGTSVSDEHDTAARWSFT